MLNLDTLVSQVEAKFPSVIYKDGKGSRAQAAAELVRSQKVTYVGEQGGRDVWNVDGYTCGIKRGCVCVDSAAPADPNGRKLCKHRLAVMFVRKLQDDHGIAAILRKTAGDRVVLSVEVLYADNGRQYTLNSYRADRTSTVLEYADRIRFTESDFADALRMTGWGIVDRPVKMGMTYRYILKRGAEIIYTANAATADQVDLAAQRQCLAEIAALDTATADNAVMQGLPAEVQNAILEHAGLTR